MNRLPVKEVICKGIAASPGIAIGVATVLSREKLEFDRKEISKNQVDEEIERFHEALVSTRSQLKVIRNRVLNRLGETAANLFESHILILDDPVVIDETIKRIRKQKRNTEWVYFDLMSEFFNTLSSSEDDYLKERGVDILDVKRRVLRNLMGEKSQEIKSNKGMRIMVAHQMTPSQTVMLDRNIILGLSVDLGGRTSHVAILAKGLEKPAVVGLKNFSDRVKNDDRLVVDGNSGKVILHPSKETLLRYRELQEKYQEFQQTLQPLKELPAKTLDGHDVQIAANIDLPDEAKSALNYGAKGIGLFRTEYIFLNKTDFPSEEEQYQEYLKVVDSIYPNSVKIRTFDLGGDKSVLGEDSYDEETPFLGWRSIRISLDIPELFLKQLKAILRASSRKSLRMMFPMISAVEEVRESKILLRQAMEELKKEGKAFNQNIEIGIMVEVPSAVLLAGHLAKEVNFFSIGTNDLIQYTLAVDRGNERIANLYTNYHPAILRQIKETVEVGHKNGIWVGLCGEMASDLHMVPFLVGLGMDELSVTPANIPGVKKLIRSIRFNSMKRLADEIVNFSTADEIEDRLKAFMLKEAPQFSEVFQVEITDKN